MGPWALLLGVALAKKPPEPPPDTHVDPEVASQEGAAQYFTQLRGLVVAAMQPARNAEAALWLPVDPNAAEPKRLELLATLDSGKKAVGVLHAYGTDRALPDAALAWFDARKALVDKLPTFWLLYARPPIGDDDLAKAEAQWPALMAEAKAIDETYRAAEVAFAERYGLRVVVPEPPAPPPEFTAPGVPPTGSALPGRVHVRFAVAYRNQLVGPQVAMATAYQTWRDAVVQWKGPAETARSGARAEVARALEAAKGVGAWQGDPSLRDAVVALGTTVLATLDGSGAEASKKSVAGPQSQRDVEAINALLAEGDGKAQAALDTYAAASKAFDEKWGIVAYAAWGRR